jgi:hypothetical protein
MRLLLLFVLTLPAFSLPAFVNAANGFQAANTVATTGDIAVTAGNAVHIVAGFDPSGGGCGAVTFAVTYTGGNTATQIGSNLSQAFSCVAHFSHVIPSTNGSTAFTVTISGSSQAALGIVVQQFSGTDVTTPLDQSASGSAASGLEIASGSFTTTVADEVISIGGWNYYDGLTADTGYVIPSGGSAAARLAMAYKIVSSIQTGVTAKMTVGNAYGSVGVATFKEGSAPVRRRQPVVN